MRVRIATFNLENLDDAPVPANQAHKLPTFEERLAVMRPQLNRIRADVLCMQEIHGQSDAGRTTLRAMDALMENTSYNGFRRVATVPFSGSQISQDEEPLPDEIPTSTTAEDVDTLRNLVIATRFDIASSRQLNNGLVNPPSSRRVTAIPDDTEAAVIRHERPFLYAKLAVDGRILHVINIHLKSKNPTDIPGQEIPPGPQNRIPIWKTAEGRAEGSFISSMKRVSQSLEVRRFIDDIFDQDGEALIVVCGDFNADLNDVPLAAIQGDVEDTENPDLAARVMTPCERTVPESSRFSLIHHGRLEMIDHVLVSRRMLEFYRGTEIHNEGLHDESVDFGFDKKFPESDHAPVVAEFEFL
jgi:exonuclease III